MTTTVKNAGVLFDDGSLQTTAFNQANFALYYLYEDTDGVLHVDTFAGDNVDVQKHMDEDNAFLLYAPIWKQISVDSYGQLVLTI